MDTTSGKTTPRLIAMAVSLVGEAHKVWARMQCTEADFLLYCAGQREPPWPEVERLISLIIHEQGIIIAKNRDMLTRLRDKHNGNSQD